MLAKSFVVAMAADIARSDYARPTLIRSRSREWLIACRWGPDGEYLSIATAGAMLDPRGLAAPDAIAPIHSLFGVLVSESETDAVSTFLLVRQMPVSIELAGTFFPADGYALLQERDTIGLICNTRYSHSCGWLGGRSARTSRIRRRPRPKRCHGTSRRSAVTGLASSFPNRAWLRGSLSAQLAEGTSPAITAMPAGPEQAKLPNRPEALRLYQPARRSAPTLAALQGRRARD
jgi:hypothetical protein